MQIKEMTREASLKFLASHGFGRIACARNLQPYITPIFFVYQDPYIYSFSTIGRKIDWLRSNPLACLEVDEVTNAQHWTSIIVLGRYEELTSKGEDAKMRDTAYNLLRGRHLWWEPGYVKTVLEKGERTLEPLYFRLSIEEITGHQAVQEP